MRSVDWLPCLPNRTWQFPVIRLSKQSWLYWRQCRIVLLIGYISYAVSSWAIVRTKVTRVSDLNQSSHWNLLEPEDFSYLICCDWDCSPSKSEYRVLSFPLLLWLFRLRVTFYLPKKFFGPEALRSQSSGVVRYSFEVL